MSAQDARSSHTRGLRIVSLTPTDQRTLTQSCRKLSPYDIVTQVEEFVLEAQLAAATLSTELRRALLSFRRFGDPSGGLLIRGVPIGVVPPTPERADAAVSTTLDAAATMSVLLGCLGDQYGFRPELGGNIVQDLLPVRGFETEQISLGSLADLNSHVEMAFSPFRSDYVALLCVRQDHERRAGTTLSSIDSMIPLLDATTVQTLREQRFRTRVDTSFLIGDNLTDDVWIEPIRVLEGAPARPQLRVDFAETEATDAAAWRALEALRRAAVAAQLVVRLRAGDLLIVDNHRASHGRTPFVPRYDGRDRWLLRSFVTKDLARSGDVRPGDGRIVVPQYGPVAT